MREIQKFLCVWVFCQHVCLSTRRPEEGYRPPGTEDICELPCGCWKSNLGPQEEQAVGHVSSIQNPIVKWESHLNKYFTKNNYSIANVKQSSKLTVGDMQTKPTVGC